MSDQGFRVTMKDRYHLTYETPDRLRIDLTYDAVFPDLDPLILSLQATRDGSSVELEPAQRQMVFDELRSALEWKGYTVHFVESR